MEGQEEDLISWLEKVFKEQGIPNGLQELKKIVSKETGKTEIVYKNPKQLEQNKGQILKVLKRLKEKGVNVVIAGHIPSDVLGLNLLFDEIEKKEPLEFIEISGFKRIRH